MKKNILIALISIFFLSTMLSCSKNESNEKVLKNNSSKIKSDLRKSGYDMRMEIIQYPLESQRIIFASKTPVEKSEIWKDKLKNSMKNTSFNTVQQEILMELYNQITPKLYVPNSTENLNFYEFHNNWIIKAKNAFPYFLIRGIVTSLDENGYIDGPPHNNENCNCSQSSDWCGTNWKCSYPPSGCNSRSWGCGTLLLYSCDGLCGYSFNN